MKKVILLLLVLVFTLSASAQQYVVLDNNFNVSGKVAAFCDKQDPLSGNTITVDDGYSWYLKNTAFSDSNYVEFWISRDSDGQHFNYSSWNKGVKVVLYKDKDGITNYLVMDKNFIHLTVIVDKNGYAGIHLCSVLRE